MAGSNSSLRPWRPTPSVAPALTHLWPDRQASSSSAELPLLWNLESLHKSAVTKNLRRLSLQYRHALVTTLPLLGVGIRHRSWNPQNSNLTHVSCPNFLESRNWDFASFHCHLPFIKTVSSTFTFTAVFPLVCKNWAQFLLRKPSLITAHHGESSFIPWLSS